MATRVVIANAQAPFRTLSDVVSFDKKQPGKLSVSTEVVRVAIHLSLNARVLTEGLLLGEIIQLTEGEIKAAGVGSEDAGVRKALLRGWPYRATRADCAELVNEDPAAP